MMKPSIKAIYSHTGLRGIAALYVFLFHLTWAGGGVLRANRICQLFQWGEYSVDLFFILSGFILHWAYISENKPVDWKSYFVARVARICPLYYLTTFFAIPIILHNIQKYGLKYVGSYFDFHREIILNLTLMSGICSLPTFNGPAWSIGVEFFCYIMIFPMLVLFQSLVQKNSLCTMMKAVLILLLVFCFVGAYRMGLVSIFDFSWNPVWLTRGIIGFSIGFLLCSLYREINSLFLNLRLINLVTLAFIGILFSVAFLDLPSFSVLFIFPFLVIYMASDRGVVAHLLRARVFQWLGERSYSIYLWQAAFITIFHDNYMKNHLGEFLSCSVVVGLVLVVSELSYRYFEHPCREWIRKAASGIKIKRTPCRMPLTDQNVGYMAIRR